jgi:hypothetical protein
MTGARPVRKDAPGERFPILGLTPSFSSMGGHSEESRSELGGFDLLKCLGVIGSLIVGEVQPA